MSDLSYLVSTRGHVRGQVTRKCNHIKSNYRTFSPQQVNEHRIFLDDYKANLDTLNSKIADLMWKENDKKAFTSELESCDVYNDQIFSASSLLKLAETVNISQPVNSGHLKYPTLPLPTYSHKDGECLEKFFKDFEKAMQTMKLDSYVQFIYLKEQLGKQPLALVESLSSTEQTYEEAKKLLQEAFGSKTLRIFETLQSLAELKLSYKADPYAYIGKVRTIKNSFYALNITVDDVLQFFVWNSLNDCFQLQLTQITNKNRPSLKEIEDNLFVAAERFLTYDGKVSDKISSNRKVLNKSDDKDLEKSSNVYAVNVVKGNVKSKSTFKACILCCNDGVKEPDHPIFKCSKYDSPELKVRKLEGMNACAKCTNAHKTRDCRFSFNRKCSLCSKWHFYYLCTGASSKVDSRPRSECTKKVKSQGEAVSKVVSTEHEFVCLRNFCEASVLPTFSVILPNKAILRGLKDTGSQLNFIDADIAKTNNLEVVQDNFSLKIKGINVPKHIITNIVKFDINDGTNIHTVEAVCIPYIGTDMKLPGLSKVVFGFVQKGYNLADKFLLDKADEISRIDFILGTVSSHIIPVTTKLFGKNIPSVFSETPLGVMLSGSIDQMIDNLDYLPDLVSETSESCGLDGVCLAADTNDEISSTSGSSEVVSIDEHVVLPECTETNAINGHVRFAVLDDNGKLVQSELEKATDEILVDHCNQLLNYDQVTFNETSLESNDKSVKYVLDSAKRKEDGRLILPLLWNHKISHLLGKNQNLSRLILKSNFKKYHKDGKSLLMIDEVFKEQETLGIIRRIENIKIYLEEHPSHSFIPHMPVFRLDKETSKCRNVFLSNLCEKDITKPMTVSHNQAMIPGPCLNKKVSTALMQLRFDKYLLCFDLKKAFLQIELPEEDQDKLLFYWYRNVSKEDFHLIVYKHVRLPFGLRPSPTLLLLALYKILIVDTSEDTLEIASLKKHIYDMLYMDNCAISSNDPNKLTWAYGQLVNIFSPYKFELQQFLTNHLSLQDTIEANTDTCTKLLGLLWDRQMDTLSAPKLTLNKNAGTKREILKSIASNFDIFSFAGPLLNRARLFMHELQCSKELDWDTRLSRERLNEWANIVKQVNSSPVISVKRFVGKRTDQYKLIAFTDSSKSIYGCVLFLMNLNSNEVSFILAKNRIVNKQLENKSMPSMEFHALSVGTEVLITTYKELAGQLCVEPINIVALELYTDSLVCLHWLNSHVNDFGKLRNLSVFVKNRLSTICKLCEEFPIKFGFCDGDKNPADAITRPLSYRSLMNSNYFNIDFFIRNHVVNDALEVTIPNPLTQSPEKKAAYVECEGIMALNSDQGEVHDHIFPVASYSSFNRIVYVYRNVLKFVNVLKARIRAKHPDKYSHFHYLKENELLAEAKLQVFLRDQQIYFPEVFAYFSSPGNRKMDMPNIVGQLNVFPDQRGLLRVKSKTARWKSELESGFAPILLAKQSPLTERLIADLHKKTSHAGVYSLLSELRKEFWIPHYFSTVKKILKNCINCRRFNRRTIKLNQNMYRDFRLDPPNIPYRSIFIDYLGPYNIKYGGKTSKVWLLCITCLWSRAVNLKICLDLTVDTFLRAFQFHIWEYGIPQVCFSDMGTQIVAGSNLISDFIKDPDTMQYLQENGIQGVDFRQYYKGCNELGSLVESCVKLVKRLIYGSIGKNVLLYHDFEYFVFQTIHLVNRRPVAFKESLRDTNLKEDIPAPITPEILLKGYELSSLNIIPNLQPVDTDPSWTPKTNPTSHIRDSYFKLRKVRSTLIELYNSEFLAQLVQQATNKKDRYQQVTHHKLQIGDLVLLKEPLLKPSNYPMGIVKEIKVNSANEVNGVTVQKGNRERVNRHVTSLIPLLGLEEYEHSIPNTKPIKVKLPEVNLYKPSKRTAAVNCRKTIQGLIEEDRL